MIEPIKRPKPVYFTSPSWSGGEVIRFDNISDKNDIGKWFKSRTGKWQYEGFCRWRLENLKQSYPQLHEVAPTTQIVKHGTIIPGRIVNDWLL